MVGKHISAQVHTSGGDYMRIYVKWDERGGAEIITEQLAPGTIGSWVEVRRVKATSKTAERRFRTEFNKIADLFSFDGQ